MSDIYSFIFVLLSAVHTCLHSGIPAFNLALEEGCYMSGQLAASLSLWAMYVCMFVQRPGDQLRVMIQHQAQYVLY